MIWLGILIAVILSVGFIWCWTDYNPDGLGVGDWVSGAFRAVGALLLVMLFMGMLIVMVLCFTGSLG